MTQGPTFKKTKENGQKVRELRMTNPATNMDKNMGKGRRYDMARQDKTTTRQPQDKTTTKLDKTRQDKTTTRQDRTRQEKAS